MKIYLLLLISSYFEGDSNRKFPQFENNSGKPIIQLVSLVSHLQSLL